jgi:hypothetical protein
MTPVDGIISFPFHCQKGAHQVHLQFAEQAESEYSSCIVMEHSWLGLPFTHSTPVLLELVFTIERAIA